MFNVNDKVKLKGQAVRSQMVDLVNQVLALDSANAGLGLLGAGSKINLVNDLSTLAGTQVQLTVVAVLGGQVVVSDGTNNAVYSNNDLEAA